MIITNAWTLIATAAGALVQKHGTNALTLAYATAEPTTETKFSLAGNEAQVMPQVGSKNIYAKAANGDVSLSVEAL